VAQPGQLPPLPPMEGRMLYVSFSAGRRGAGSVDCLECGVPLHRHDDGPWHDGHGDHVSFDLDRTKRHTHTPAHEIGPTFGPFTYVEVTYQLLRVDDGEVLASWDEGRGEWVLAEFAGEELAGQGYSDAVTFPVRPGDTDYHQAQRDQTGKARDYSDVQ
jgi:hypothetical protein